MGQGRGGGWGGEAAGEGEGSALLAALASSSFAEPASAEAWPCARASEAASHSACGGLPWTRRGRALDKCTSTPAHGASLGA